MTMIPAPLSFLRGRGPPRTTVRHHNPFMIHDSENRTFEVEYFPRPSSEKYFGKQVFPPAKQDLERDPLQQFKPPPHYHLLQDEHFKVESGEGLWYLWGGKTLHLKAGDEVVVPARRWHWFENAPESKEPLSVVYRYDAEYAEMEERFFRNVFGYTEDCRKAGMAVSKVQLAVFCIHNWMPLGILSLGPEWLNLVVNTLLTLLIACFGEFLLGYKRSYPEYFEEKGRKD